MRALIYAGTGVFRIMLTVIFFAACHAATKKPPPARYIFEIKEMRFQPAELSLHPGDTIEWINHDIVDHDITGEKNKDWHSGVLKNGQSWKTVIYQTTGYYCSIHVVMKGKLVVAK